MTIEQTNSLAALQALLLSARGITEPLQTTTDGNAVITLVNGAIVRIGRKGGYALPEVRSYPESKEVGKRAIDAACNADLLLAKQTARGGTKVLVPVAPAFDGFADVPAI